MTASTYILPEVAREVRNQASGVDIRKLIPIRKVYIKVTAIPRAETRN